MNLVEHKRILGRARAAYIELATKPERERLLVFDVNTSKWSATRVKAREQHLRALKRAETEVGEYFDEYVVGRDP